MATNPVTERSNACWADQAVCEFIDNEPAGDSAPELIDGKTVDPMFDGYKFTVGAKAMMDRHLLGNATSEKSCFLFTCWGYRPVEEARKKLLELLKFTKETCVEKNPKKDEFRQRDIISANTVGLVIDVVHKESGGFSFSASHAESAIPYLLGGITEFHREEGHSDKLIQGCAGLTVFDGAEMGHFRLNERQMVFYNNNSGKASLATIKEL